MAKKKALIGFVMVLALLVLQVNAALAAPAAQGTSVSGTIQSVTPSTDSSGNTIFIVTILDSSGNTQTVQVSATDAETLGLVTPNGDGTYTINNVVGTTITIPSNMIIPTPCTSSEGNLVARMLAAFFCANGSTVLDNSVDALHSEGFGFGEIAQSCFMAEVLQTTCGSILDAKKSHDFTTLGVPTTVDNWGQLKKYVLAEEVHSLTNLGAIMSGRATPPTPVPTPTGTPMAPMFLNGNGNGNGHGNGHGGGNGNGNGHGHNP